MKNRFNAPKVFSGRPLSTDYLPLMTKLSKETFHNRHFFKIKCSFDLLFNMGT